MDRQTKGNLIAIGGIVILLLIVFALAAHGEEGPPCAPCKIEGVIKTKDGKEFERFKYLVWPGFPTKEKCEAELTSEAFKLAMADLQAKTDNLAQLGDEFHDMKASAECVQLNQ